MKTTFFLFISILIIPHTFIAMDFDKENGIALEAIYRPQQPLQKTNRNPLEERFAKPLEERFADFEQKIKSTFGNNGWFNENAYSTPYFKTVQQELPGIIANDETIKQYAHNENSYFGKVIKNLIDIEARSHYKKVTCDTLATINNPNAQQPSSILNNLPFTIKKYIMDCAYNNINKKYEWLTFSQDTNDVNIHGMVNLAATAHNGTFQIWDLLTRTAHTLQKKSMWGAVKFSSNGSQLITISLFQKEPLTVHIDIWDCRTKQNTHTIEYHKKLLHCSLENKSSNLSTLVIIDNSGNVLLYKIEKNTLPILLEHIKTNITNIVNTLAYAGDYEFSLDYFTLYKKCTPYFLCLKAIQNTTNKNSLNKAKTALLYAFLTQYEKSSIDKRISEKSEELTQREEPFSNFRYLFG